MARILSSPAKYTQGPGLLNNLEEYVNNFGSKAIAVCDPFVLEILEEKIKSGLENLDLVVVEFNGECCKTEIDRIKEVVLEEEGEMVLGFGGGKTLDTAKAVAHYTNLPVGIIPTIAATDAPCSALSVIYTEDGIFEEYLFLPTNPDLVLLDTEVIADAPVDFLIAGMGDALATYFEADACSVTKAENISGGTQTIASLNLAKLCYDTLLKYGEEAKKSVEAGVVNEAVEKIVEANTLLSGLGFESGGLAAAHSIHNGFTVLEETHDYTHGEKVAYSTLVQLVLADRPPEVIKEVTEFCELVGLPTTLEDLGITEVKEEEIMEVAEASCVEGETVHNMPHEVTPKMVKDAILAVNEYNQ